MNSELDGFLRSTLNRQLLKSAAGRAIFCPSCGTILDWKQTTLVDVYCGDTAVKAFVACTPCWAKKRQTFLDGVRLASTRLAKPLRIEIVDAKGQTDLDFGKDKP